jgi:hypothetical protein
LDVPVNSTHPDYDANLAAWQRARDVMAGEDIISVNLGHYRLNADYKHGVHF